MKLKDYTQIDMFGRGFEYMVFDEEEIQYIFSLLAKYKQGVPCYIFVEPCEAVADFISAKFLYFEFFCRKEVEFLVEGDRHERVSVRVDVLKKVVQLLRSGEERQIEIAIEALTTVVDKEVRESVRKQKRELYFKFHDETDPLKKTIAYEEYRKFIRECLI